MSVLLRAALAEAIGIEMPKGVLRRATLGLRSTLAQGFVLPLMLPLSFEELL